MIKSLDLMGKLKLIKNPEIFQGNKDKKSYFEGWYFKIVTHEGSNIYAIIPGIALDKKNNSSHSFIQFFDGMKGEYTYFTYDVEEFKASKERFEVHVQNSYFSQNEIRLDIDKNGKRIEGTLKFENLVPYPSTFFSPGIMGIFSYFPMQTKHGIVSMNHDVVGHLTVNQQHTKFKKGSKGYIEKDWGSSFPSSWIWMQSNHFSIAELSFVSSVASIPILGYNIIGFFCVIWHNGNFYKFATYTRAKLRKVQIEGNTVFIIGENPSYRFEIKAIQGEATDMKAPSMGEMRSHCFESMNSTIHLKLIDKKSGKLIIEDIGKYAGVEIMDNEELER